MDGVISPRADCPYSLETTMVRLSYQDIDETYEQIKRSACGRQACSVMVLVANEVDAMAATRMLTQLLRIDNIAYVVRPVTNFSQVLQNYRNYVTPEIKTIILINCGATHNIPKAFELEKGGETRCFILDNHRPFHLANVHARHNVVVFDDSHEIEANNENGVVPSDGSELSGASDDDTSEEDDDADEAEDGEVGHCPICAIVSLTEPSLTLAHLPFPPVHTLGQCLQRCRGRI